MEDDKSVKITDEYSHNSHSDALRKITFGYNITCKCCNHTKFIKEENYASLPKFYSKEEVDKLTSEAYNQGYEDGKVFFYGMTSKDEERVKQTAKNIMSDEFETNELKTEDLWDADPDCKHERDENCWSGIRCKHCGGWFCF
jgi:hypothetical protein